MNESNGKGNWSKVAEECRNRYNETNHSVTGFSPKYLLSDMLKNAPIFQTFKATSQVPAVGKRHPMSKAAGRGRAGEQAGWLAGRLGTVTALSTTLQLFYLISSVTQVII
ncbi:hypothetical protein EVAR_70899_1 [Eumeta japonica]|uniref:Uncharacterized protein n=1 Tax=Eumeta variegata TaxID=151549 RepID=A0A4C2ABP4_EUMVA|nr:hypothetical protein EVAR_70899_1 [Eumeta japonica]